MYVSYFNYIVTKSVRENTNTTTGNNVAYTLSDCSVTIETTVEQG